MSKNLLLINPWIYDFAAYDLWSKPLGILYLASFLRQYGFNVSFIDCLQNESKDKNSKKYGVGHYRREIIDKPEILKHIPRNYARYGISENDFIKQLKANNNADAVLVTSIMTYWYPAVVRVVELARKYLPGVPVILGGIYASLVPDHAQKVVKPDYLITGPGEEKLLQLLIDLWKLNIKPEDKPYNLDDFPYPAFDLLNDPTYLIMMTEHGCPYDCSFCAQKKISRAYSRRGVKQVIEEFEYHYKKFHLRDFAFYDDALFINKEKHIQPILEGLVNSKMPFRLHSPNGLFARYVDDTLAGLMYKSGFKTIRLSFETSNEQRRKDMYSKVSNEEMVQAVQSLVKAGFKAKDIQAYVLMGLPGQSLEEVIASILFIHNLGVLISLASFSPIPGTQEFDKAVEAGKISEDIDPLLTNNSIYPLSDGQLSYEKYRKIRTFTQVLNEAAQRGLSLFTDIHIGSEIRNVVSQIEK